MLELRSNRDGAFIAERERLKNTQRKRRENEGLKKRERQYERKRLEDPEYLNKRRKYYAEWRQKRVRECQEVIFEWKRQGCCVCGESDICCIDAHHKNQDEKEHNVGGLVYGAKAMASILEELDKCIPICSNCHRKYHAGEDKDVVAAVVEITGHPWRPVKGHGIRNGKKERKRMGRLGPFGKPVYEDEQIAATELVTPCHTGKNEELEE